jgi:uncharacterized protein YjbI with pentapeptide repeats
MRPGDEEIDGQKKLLETHRRTLAFRLRQQAAVGKSHLPPEIAHDINEARYAIRTIKATLRNWGVEVEDHPDDEPKLIIHAGPYQVPQRLRHYVGRQDKDERGIEDRLKTALLDHDGEPLTILYGMAGSGKSSLAIHTVHNLQGADFPDGVLWGDLANLTPNDLFLTFLGALDGPQYRDMTGKTTSLRELFWQYLDGGRALIVLDNIKDARQLLELLPADPGRLARCRILAICLHKLIDPSLPDHHELKLSYFSEREALELFHKHMREEQYEMYSENLREISRRLEYLPQLLATAARDFATGKISPSAYLLTLRQGESQSHLIGSAVRDGLDLAVRELSPEQIELFELIGVLGEGDWHEAMLAAIALRPLAEVRQTVALLADNELIKPAGNNRYRANSLIRDFAQERLNRRSQYRRHAAYTLLAHYCLNIAQDLDTALMARPDLREAPGQPVNLTSEAFIQAFRAGLMPEISHFRAALEWAEHRGAWDILRRFSYLSYIDLLKHFVTNGFEIRLSLSMATVLEPVVWLQGDQLSVRIQSAITSTGWKIRSLSDNRETFDQGVTATDLTLPQNRPPSEGECCELSLNIAAGHIIDGVFDTMCLIAVKWTGVRANGLICKKVDIVGGQFLACDLSHSIWVGCDARRVSLIGSNMSYAVLKDVKLRGANLQGLLLTGAVLEKVDLRDADLRDANLVGAMLRDVDLRGADLRGADLTAVQVHNLNLIGCRIEHTRWAGAATSGIIVEDVPVLREIEQEAAKQPDKPAEQIYRRARRTQELADHDRKDFPDADLSAVDLEGDNLTEYNLRDADLRAAVLRNTVLRRARLERANLRGADLAEADMERANLRGADLRATVLAGAVLEKADLSAAVLRSAYVAQANLRGADLSGADLYTTDVHGADLSGATIREANLSYTNLRDAKLKGASLQRANLHKADLTGADLMSADLAGAICTEANFRDARVSDDQLAQAGQLDRAILSSDQAVAVLADSYDNTLSLQSFFLRFAHCSGRFEQIKMNGHDMFGAHLNGTFIDANFRGATLAYARMDGTFTGVDLSGANLAHAQLSGIFSSNIDANAEGAQGARVDLSRADLAHAQLSGTFSEVDFSQAILSHAQLSGIFSRVTFRSADLREASLQDASLVNVSLEGVALSDAQLKQAKRLRGTIMPDGNRYDGRFQLGGDIEDARQFGINPDDPAEMAERFYNADRVRVKLA